MYKLLKDSFPALLVLLQNLSNKTLVEALLRKSVVFTIAELVHNLLLSNIRLSAKEKAKLRPFNKELLELVKKNRSIEYKAQLLLHEHLLLKQLLLLGIPILTELFKNNGQIHHGLVSKKVCPAHRSDVQSLERW